MEREREKKREREKDKERERLILLDKLLNNRLDRMVKTPGTPLARMDTETNAPHKKVLASQRGCA